MSGVNTCWLPLQNRKCQASRKVSFGRVPHLLIRLREDTMQMVRIPSFVTARIFCSSIKSEMSISASPLSEE
ncbi:hypothetical protein Tcan_13292 [Toxocara canis]|uniref:Uncharacterized protein n=1 Tax=Toxocara canis TaxID=6265 RepID=A0A0B2VVX0_TOXCA|nr:hypothetical protein Tcan_13292 [Toxocara canis]